MMLESTPEQEQRWNGNKVVIGMKCHFVKTIGDRSNPGINNLAVLDVLVCFELAYLFYVSHISVHSTIKTLLFVFKVIQHLLFASLTS
jgi:hypothetical protein